MFVQVRRRHVKGVVGVEASTFDQERMPALSVIS
jgi:hypothetical protein